MTDGGAAPSRVRDLLRLAANRLLAVAGADDLDEAQLEVELLYGRAAGLDRVHVLAAGGDAVDPAVSEPFEALLLRRLAHEPLAYILGQREFYGLTFEVGDGALVPRPETETLVEAALAAIREHPRNRRLVRVADIGTGTGIVAIAVARHAPSVKMFAVDASTAALQWAGKNRRRLGPMERVVLLTGDLLAPLSEPLDVLLANLPYVPTEEYETLPDEIRAHEPELAVDGGDDGLDIYRRFAEQLPAHLVDDTYAVLVEIGAGQALFAEDILLDALGRPTNAEVRTHRDLRGIRRVVEVRVGY
ncbi:MAG: peptide chain release factor N(5)-glutamine methyltransferase [Chloroflexi bacterium]|nr:peptide chain release factor N(5)-glutamine methyltransferase [Chloroflexota bacterium]MDA1146620.1 peptide chain release factor N(5)-glutamine methyltransferase [Chloroflexota bacterium]